MNEKLDASGTSSITTIRTTLENEPGMLRVPTALKPAFRHYRLRGLERYVLSGAPPLAILTLGLTLVTSWLLFDSMSDHDKGLWLAGSMFLCVLVLLGASAMMLANLRRFYTIAVPILSAIALTKLASMPQLFHAAEIATAESYFCITTMIIVVLALKLSPVSASLTVYSAGAASLILLAIVEVTPSYTAFFYYYFVPAKVCLFASMLREQQEIKEFFQDRLISHDKTEMERLNRELSILAHSDSLSGLANRRWFDATLDREWDRHIRGRNHLSLLFIDLDHFKAFNDTYGHAEGDACLAETGKAIMASLLRPGDLAARYGGEEFVVLLPDTDCLGAMDVANRILESIDKLGIPHNMSDTGKVTASIGCASMIPRPDSSSATLLKRADDALYQAKHAGRHQVKEWKDVANESPEISFTA